MARKLFVGTGDSDNGRHSTAAAAAEAAFFYFSLDVCATIVSLRRTCNPKYVVSLYLLRANTFSSGETLMSLENIS